MKVDYVRTYVVFYKLYQIHVIFEISRNHPKVDKFFTQNHEKGKNFHSRTSRFTQMREMKSRWGSIHGDFGHNQSLVCLLTEQCALVPYFELLAKNW